MGTIMLPGLKVEDLRKNVDERGLFAEILREDWKELLRDDTVQLISLTYAMYTPLVAVSKSMENSSNFGVDHS